jgi:diguanylate cyclase (GGDEF)-like protein
VVTFDANDRALLETFARHVATSLERGRLETTLRQVTDLKEQLRHQALHDTLTGLPNRALFLDRVRQAVESAPRTGEWPTVLYLDLDGFKPVNDTHGHDAGDVLLRNVAGRLRACLRPADTAARLGGDEFAVLLTEPLADDGLARVVERICTQVAVPVDLGDGRYASVRTSIGVAAGSPRTRTADDLVRNADVAMYSAKRRGGSRHVVFDPTLGEPVALPGDTAAELAAAVRAGEIAVAYQPLVDLASGRVVGAEALARWQHQDGTRLPERFLGLAEDTGLISEVGKLVLRDACRQAATWLAGGADPDTLLVTVNLCVPQLAEPGLPDEVAAALAGAGLDPRHLVLEITETALMQDRETAATTLWRLRELGVRIAIDDFGTGYSSLAYLRRFPIDMLKVAREFVDGLGRDVHDDVITRAIVDLAGTLGLLTVAEGVETEAQRRHVAELGCDLAQGFLFAHPLPAAEVTALLAAPTPVL